MAVFRPNDRVVCVDATPLPINVRGAVITEFTFPGGFVREGEVYCVELAGTGSDGHPSLFLVGVPVLHRGVEIGWNGQRFRRLRGSAGRSAARRCRKGRKAEAEPVVASAAEGECLR